MPATDDAVDPVTHLWGLQHQSFVDAYIDLQPPEISAILRPVAAEFTIPLEASKLKIAGDYWRMGTIHIL